MTEPRHVSELLTEWVARVAALGPFLVRIEMTQPTLDKLKTLTPEVKSQVSRGQALGYLSSDRVSPLAGVAVRAVSDLPPGALRLHYSDGRVVTRYRLVRDPRALQVCFRDQEYGLRANRGERHGLSLMVRFGRSWVYGDPPPAPDAGRHGGPGPESTQLGLESAEPRGGSLTRGSVASPVAHPAKKGQDAW